MGVAIYVHQPTGDHRQTYESTLGRLPDRGFFATRPTGHTDHGTLAIRIFGRELNSKRPIAVLQSGKTAVGMRVPNGGEEVDVDIGSRGDPPSVRPSWLQLAQARIEQVADAVAEQVEAEHGQHQGGT